MRTTGTLHRWRLPSLLLATTLAVGLTSALPGADADPTAVPDDAIIVPGTATPQLALLEVGDERALHDLEHYHGIDLAHWHEPTDAGTTLTAAFVDDADLAYLAELGIDVLETEDVPTPETTSEQMSGSIDRADIDRRIARYELETRDLQLQLQASDAAAREQGTATTASVPPPVDETDLMSVLRVDTFTNYAGDMLSVEVRSLVADTDDQVERPERIRISYDDGDRTVTRTLSVFNDAGKYIYHRLNRPVIVEGGTPSEVRVDLYTLSRDGQDNEIEELAETLVVPTNAWSPYGDIGYPDGFEWGFIDGYLDATDSVEAIHELAEEFPDLAEIIEMPYETNGYQRKAMAMYAAEDGTPASAIVNVESLEWGHLGGNDLSFEIAGDDTPDLELSVAVVADAITVTPATDGDGQAISTAAEVVAAINADEEASDLIRAFTYRGSDGANVVEDDLGPMALSDGLTAPLDKIERGPRTMYTLRIGAERDGSKTGVFAYSQEHAREWVTPVVAVETATRLLRNYGTDEVTTALVDNLDIFIAPTMNPDGTDYSMYDNATQRSNLTRYCGDELGDWDMRHSWGVNINRNFREYSYRDGYQGGSDQCTSTNFPGPEELSEPEAQNEAWLVEQHPNIRFSMNVHTHGGYFMWAPGAYMNPGRIPAPRPELGIEDYFFDVSEIILGRIAEHRGTVIEPGRTGPIIDVLYSAAGNSADDHWYRSLREGRPIFGWSFEAGANRFEDGRWVGVGGFFPDFVDEGFDQAMEFSNGIYGMLEAALEFEFDDQAPTTAANVRDDVRYDGPADVFFTSDESATIHYTVDGSEPSLDSPTVQRRGARDSAAPIRLDETTTLKWFGVDAAGNEEDVNELEVHIDEDPPVSPDPDPEPDPDPDPEPVPGEACADVTGGSFPDVQGGPHGDSIGCVAGYGIAEGSTDGTYRPLSDVRRDQMTSFIARLLRVAGVELPSSPADAFADDDGGAHELATNQLAALGIVEGRGGGVFSPADPVTRAQMASFLVRSLEHITDGPLSASAGPFVDTAGSPHSANIDVAADLGVALGRTPTQFAPNADVRRDQMASFLARTLDVLQAGGTELTPLR